MIARYRRLAPWPALMVCAFAALLLAPAGASAHTPPNAAAAFGAPSTRDLNAPRTAPAQTGPYSVLVALVRFSDQPVPTQPNLQPALIQENMFGASDSVASYYDAVSFGQVDMTGTVTPWLDLGINWPVDRSGCNGVHEQEVTDALTAAGYNPAAYDTVVEVVYTDSACPGMGFAALGGSRTWILVGETIPHVGEMVAIHEIGHNMGMAHASRLYSLPSNAASAEYGDIFDFMGVGNGINLPHQRQMGWVPANRVTQVSTSGTFTIDASDLTAGTAGIEITPPANLTAPISGPGRFFVEFERTNPWSGGMYESMFQPGAMIRATRQDYATGFNTYLVDAHPETRNTSLDSAFRAGEAWRDPTGTVSIHVVSVSDASAVVRVKIAPDALDPGITTDDVLPSTVSNLTASIAGSHPHLSWAAGSDPAPGAMRGYTMLRRQLAPGPATSFAKLGEAATTSWTDTTAIEGRTYEYEVRSIDWASNESAGKKVRLIFDVTAPSRPTSLRAGKARPTTTLRWNPATDACGIRGYVIRRTNRATGTTAVLDTIATTSLKITIPKGSKGFAYAVAAIDNCSLQGSWSTGLVLHRT